MLVQVAVAVKEGTGVLLLGFNGVVAVLVTLL
jgi:hypothetical protein